MASQVESIKWITGTNFIVDGFRFQNPRCTNYFLTHFHSDHTTGLNKTFRQGIIWCTQVTCNLLVKDMGMSPEFIRVLEYEHEITIEGVGVTAMPANHCPGACLLLFKVPHLNKKIEVILHTGDFRWQDWMLDYRSLRSIKVDTLYLDTTYALPKHRLPSQEQTIGDMVSLMKQALIKEPRTLFVMSSYHIGKEKAFFGAARLLGIKLWVTPAKRRVLRMLDLPDEDMALLAKKPEHAQLYVVSGGLRHDNLHEYLKSAPKDGHIQSKSEECGANHLEGCESRSIEKAEQLLINESEEAAQDNDTDQFWKHIMGIKPTGWSLRRNGKPSVWSQDNVTMLGVPYSEHSSWDELRSCVRNLRPSKLVPTVNVETPQMMRAMIDRFADLMDNSKDRSRISFYLQQAPVPIAASLPCEKSRSRLTEQQGVTPRGNNSTDLTHVNLESSYAFCRQFSNDSLKAASEDHRRAADRNCETLLLSQVKDGEPMIIISDSEDEVLPTRALDQSQKDQADCRESIPTSSFVPGPPCWSRKLPQTPSSPLKRLPASQFLEASDSFDLEHIDIWEQDRIYRSIVRSQKGSKGKERGATWLGIGKKKRETNRFKRKKRVAAVAESASRISDRNATR